MTPATASGQSTGESNPRTLPSPQTAPATTAMMTATASAVTANQITRACLYEGGGKSICRSTLAQFFRLFRRRTDGVHERCAQTAFLQFVQTLNGCPPRTRDHILERSWMLAGFQNHFRAAEHGLRGKPRGHVTWQSRGHATVAERLDDRVNVSRTAAAETRHRVEQRFLELNRQSDRRKQFLHQAAVFRRCVSAERVSGGRRADQRRRVWHHAYDSRPLIQASLQFRQRHARRNGNKQVLLGE